MIVPKFLLARLTRLMFMPFAAGAVVVPTGGGGGASGDTGGSSGSGGGNSGVPSAQSGATGDSPSSGQNTSTGGTGGSPTIDWGTAPQQLRDEYDRVKAEHEKWSKLGDYDTASTHAQTTRQFIEEAYTSGEKLGFTEQQIQNSLTKNFLGTINFLRQKAAEANGSNNNGGQGGQNQGGGQKSLQDQIKEALDQQLGPINKDLQDRQVQAANNRFDGEVNRLMQESFKTDFGTMPTEVKNLFLDAASELFKYDTQGSQDLFKNGKVAGVQKAFNEAKTIIEGAFIKWQQWKTSGAGGQQTGGGNRQSSGGGNNGNSDADLKGSSFLDSIINGEDAGFSQLDRMRKR